MNSNKESKESKQSEEEKEVLNEDEIMINNEQLEEYREMLIELGPHPDKVLINTLSMVAEDHRQDEKTSKVLYSSIINLLQQKSDSTDSNNTKLPLVYVIDSILKNVGGAFISLVEQDAKHWIPIVYNSFQKQVDLKTKLKKVLGTWSTQQLFSTATLREMNVCFEQDEAVTAAAAAKTKAAEQKVSKLDSALRQEMQMVLDELNQNENELEKLSLERLCVVNPGLFDKILLTAQDIVKNNGGMTKTTLLEEKSDDSLLNPLFGQDTIIYEWNKVSFSVQTSQALVSSLQSLVRDGSISTSAQYAPSVSLLSSASAICTHLTSIQSNKQSLASTSATVASSASLTNNVKSSFSLKIDENMFTTELITKMSHLSIVNQLYHQGLPFLSSSDGRRFATQAELSHHLDTLFQKSQIEKTMTKKEQRGWFSPVNQWTFSSTTSSTIEETQEANKAQQKQVVEKPVDEFFMPADDQRSKCRICGLNFDMFFDHSFGDFRYKNCIEMEVVETGDKVLVHESCRRNLGRLDYLTVSQILSS